MPCIFTSSNIFCVSVWVGGGLLPTTVGVELHSQKCEIYWFADFGACCSHLPDCGKWNCIHNFIEGSEDRFYVDQRENRQFISRISDGQKVLDICCFSGGFALNVVRGGALNVTGTLYVVNSALFFITNYHCLWLTL